TGAKNWPQAQACETNKEADGRCRSRRTELPSQSMLVRKPPCTSWWADLPSQPVPDFKLRGEEVPVVLGRADRLRHLTPEGHRAEIGSLEVPADQHFLARAVDPVQLADLALELGLGQAVQD